MHHNTPPQPLQLFPINMNVDLLKMGGQEA